jgi:hypothetical protein
MKDLSSLEQLDLSENQFTELPDVIPSLTKLTSLSLAQNKLQVLNKEIGYLSLLQGLDLSNNNLTELPEEIGNLKSLTYLFSSENQISILPSSIENFTELLNLDLSANEFSELPQQIMALTSLQTLSLNNNHITLIPDDISTLGNLNHLNLSGNQFRNLPEALIRREGLFIEYIDTPYYNEIHAIATNQTPLQQWQQAHNSSDLIDLLSKKAGFSESEKMSSHQNLLSLNEKIESQTSRANDDSASSENLSVRLGAMLEFFHTQVENQNVFSKLITSFNRFLIESSSWNSQTSQAGDDPKRRQSILSHQLLTILSEIYEKRNDNDFLKSVEQIIDDSLEDCRDRNSLLMYSLANFCQRKSVDELNSMMTDRPLQLFDYLKNQLLYNYFLNLGQERVDEMKNGIQGVTDPNPHFTEDVEVLLNYLRIYNINFKDKLDLDLPNIKFQSYYTMKEYKPSDEQIREFADIANEYKDGNKLPLCQHLASIASANFDKSLPITNPEILELSLVKERNQKIIEIAGEFMELFENYASKESISDSVYTSKIDQIKDFKDLLTKEQFQQIFQNSLSQLASRQQPATEFTPNEIKAIEEKFSKFFKDNLGIEVKKQQNETSQLSPSQTVSGVTARPASSQSRSPEIYSIM